MVSSNPYHVLGFHDTKSESLEPIPQDNPSLCKETKTLLTLHCVPTKMSSIKK
jgi:hypothetical protein